MNSLYCQYSSECYCSCNLRYCHHMILCVGEYEYKHTVHYGSESYPTFEGIGYQDNYMVFNKKVDIETFHKIFMMLVNHKGIDKEFAQTIPGYDEAIYNQIVYLNLNSY